jgi:hypothetical protein
MLNYAELRQRGIQHLERMTGRSWTDFNAHDPGITLLEGLCYALTDLSYRTDYDVADLLADGGSNPFASLHAPADILTTRAVTPDDLRRLVIDVEGVKNAWIEDVEERLPGSFAPLLGLYRVVVETSSEREGIHVRREVGRRLHKNRGLCEDFTDIIILDPLKVRIDASVEIGRVDDPVETYAQILDAIAEVISPTIPFTSLETRLATGASIEEIFEGPLLEHGFITDADLDRAHRRVAIHSSDIIHAIMDVPGVRAVTEIMMRAGDTSNTWSLDVPSDRAARLDRAFSRITLQNAGLPVAIGAPSPAEPTPRRIKVGPGAGITHPPARNRNVGVYQSVQHLFPDLYGIGAQGLPNSATPARKGRAKQLQAYLMLFDQLLANQFAQLAHVKDLFSIHPTEASQIDCTYFAQTVDEPTLGLAKVANATQSMLVSMTENPAERSSRRHRFLNHLLARFSENLNDRYVAAGGDAPDALEKLVAHKQRFLQQYARISGSRGTAFDGLGPWGRANPSGLEERIKFKLGLFEDDGEQMIVIEHLLTRPSQLHQFDWLSEQWPASSSDPYSLKLTFVFPGDKGRFANMENDSYPFREVVERTLRAQSPAHLGTYVVWLDDTGWDQFTVAHTEWRRRRREHLASKLGISLGLDSRLRATVVDSPLVPGYSAVTGSEPHVIDYGESITVSIDGSQEGGATYSLLRASDEVTISTEPVEGNGKTIEVITVPNFEDFIVRVHVERLFDDPILLDAVLTLKVRANPAVGVEAKESPLVDPVGTSTITIHDSQTSVTYSVYARKLLDGDFFQPEDVATVTVAVPAITGISAAATMRFLPATSEVWNVSDYALVAEAISGNGGDLHISIGTIPHDSIVAVRAHKDHGATPPDATDLQITQSVALLARPGAAPALVLAQLSDNVVSVTGGEAGVLYYLLDPVSNEVLGKPAYFNRTDVDDPAQNRGIGQLRIARDLVVALGPIAAGADRTTTAPLDPTITLSSWPANNTVKVMAIRARTGVAWENAKTMEIQVSS